VITMISSIVRRTKRISCLYLASALAAAVLIACVWISPAAEAGTNSANETAAPSAYADSGNSSVSQNYGGMVVAGIIAVLTAVLGAAVWRAHEVAMQKNAALQEKSQAVAARRGAEDIIDHLLEQLREKLEPIDHLEMVEEAQRMVETFHEKFGFTQDPEGLSRWSALLQDQGDRLMVQALFTSVGQATFPMSCAHLTKVSATSRAVGAGTPALLSFAVSCSEMLL
jgi:hypothetical protein